MDSQMTLVTGQFLQLVLLRVPMDDFSSPDKQCLCIFITVINFSPMYFSICGRDQHRYHLLICLMALTQQYGSDQFLHHLAALYQQCTGFFQELSTVAAV